MKRKGGFVVLLSLLLFFTLAISASAAKPITTNDGDEIEMTTLFQAKTFTSSTGKKINYRIFLPENYSTQTKYPLILFLHGADQRGNDNQSQLVTGITEPFKDKNSQIYNCIVIAPQCPAGERWVDVPAWDKCQYDTTKIKESTALAAVAELFVKAQEEYSVDKSRVYGTGLSMGAYGTWDLMVRHPDLFTAAVPICGGADYRKAEVIKEIPIWTFHGLKDGVVPYYGTEKMAQELAKIGGNCIYETYPDGGHAIWPDVYARADVLTWLLSQKKAGVEPEIPDEPETPDEPVPVSPEEPEEPQKGGCGGVVQGAIPFAAVTAAAAAVALKKKKKED